MAASLLLPTHFAAPVTADGRHYQYSIQAAGSTDVVTAPRKAGGNEREFFWSAAAPVEADSTVCATFASGQGFDQQGVALRISDVAGVVTGITVTRNVYDSLFNYFNVHTWNTADTSQIFTLLGTVQISALPLAPATYPLSLCARTQGTEVQFVVWLPGQSQPNWGNPTWGGQIALPVGAPVAGQGGWYAGHLEPGTSMTYDSLSVDGLTLKHP